MKLEKKNRSCLVTMTTSLNFQLSISTVLIYEKCTAVHHLTLKTYSIIYFFYRGGEGGRYLISESVLKAD